MFDLQTQERIVIVVAELPFEAMDLDDLVPYDITGFVLQWPRRYDIVARPGFHFEFYSTKADEWKVTTRYQLHGQLQSAAMADPPVPVSIWPTRQSLAPLTLLSCHRCQIKVRRLSTTKMTWTTKMRWTTTNPWMTKICNRTRHSCRYPCTVCAVLLNS